MRVYTMHSVFTTGPLGPWPCPLEPSTEKQLIKNLAHYRVVSYRIVKTFKNPKILLIEIIEALVIISGESFTYEKNT